jgi:hypothetical protein
MLSFLIVNLQIGFVATLKMLYIGLSSKFENFATKTTATTGASHLRPKAANRPIKTIFYGLSKDLFADFMSFP